MLAVPTLFLAFYSFGLASALRCQLYSGDKAVIREIEFTSNADFPVVTGNGVNNATVELLPAFFETNRFPLVMEHDGFACPKDGKATCSPPSLSKNPGCARSFYSTAVIAAAIDNSPGNTLSFQARQSNDVWLVGCGDTCATREYTPMVKDMKTVAFASQVPHTWVSARVYLDQPYLGFSKSWQCDYDGQLLPDTPHFEPQEGGKVWQIRNIAFQSR